MPAVPLGEAGVYVAAAFGMFAALVLVYVAIIGAKIARIERELGALSGAPDAGGPAPLHAGGPAPLHASGQVPPPREGP